MKYPKFLKKNDTIGITAISCGCGNELKETKISFNHLKEEYKLIITPNVYGNLIVSSSREERIKEFNSLLDEDIRFLMIYRGGDFTYEILDELDYEKLIEKNIWVMGYSDPTSLLYILTVKYDLATIYGFNAKGYDSIILEKYQINNLELLKGHIIKQESFMDRNTISINGDFESSGVIIGGCLDVLRYLWGTDYDNTKNFLEKYGDKRIIWYFDIFQMGSVDVYLTLLQMKRMGYFKYSDTFIIGSVLYPKIECDMDYKEVYQKVFEDKNVIIDANIGHVKPCFTVINGSIAHVCYKKRKMILDMEFMDENNG